MRARRHREGCRERVEEARRVKEGEEPQNRGYLKTMRNGKLPEFE